MLKKIKSFFSSEPETPVIYKTPWMDWMAEREGWNEKNNDKELAEYWKYTTYSAGQKDKTVRGRKYAWCAMTVNAALFESGYVGNRSARAKSFESYGSPCDPKFGSIIVMRHPRGGYHVTFFDHWIAKDKMLAVCFGGNQGDSLKKSVYDLSGNERGHDEIIASRWPIKAT